MASTVIPIWPGSASFAAVSARIDTTIHQNWNYVYKINGNLYRSIAPVLEDEDQHFNIQGGKYYILDTDEAHELRVANNPNLNRSVSLEIILYKFNKYLKIS